MIYTRCPASIGYRKHLMDFLFSFHRVAGVSPIGILLALLIASSAFAGFSPTAPGTPLLPQPRPFMVVLRDWVGTWGVYA